MKDVTLTPADLVAHEKQFLAIASDVPGEYWTLENLLADLRDKWLLSFAVWLEGVPIAYAIVSRKTPSRRIYII